MSAQSILARLGKIASTTAKKALRDYLRTNTKTRAYYRDREAPLPQFTYHPAPNDQPDPGEVVWAWVPYEEDPTVGKDRPVLVLAHAAEGVIAAQLTSQDHDQDAEQEARWGRAWMDIGTGNWDRQRRPSEVRLDRLLVLPPSGMRREGGKLPRQKFNAVCEAITRHFTEHT